MSQRSVQVLTHTHTNSSRGPTKITQVWPKDLILSPRQCSQGGSQWVHRVFPPCASQDGPPQNNIYKTTNDKEPPWWWLRTCPSTAGGMGLIRQRLPHRLAQFLKDNKPRVGSQGAPEWLAHMEWREFPVFLSLWPHSSRWRMLLII